MNDTAPATTTHIDIGKEVIADSFPHDDTTQKS
jgi:hypothetical protein